MVTLLVSCSDYTRATCLSSFKFPETLFCDLSVGLTAHNDSQTCKVRCTFETLSSRRLAEDKADISDEYNSFTRVVLGVNEGKSCGSLALALLSAVAV